MNKKKSYKYRALLVDDDLEDLAFLMDFLEYKDCQCIGVNSLAAAMDKIGNEKFDLYIIDLQIPAEDNVKYLLKDGIHCDYPGLGLAQYLRSHSINGIKIVANPAHDRKEVSEYITRIGCRYVLKGRPDILKSVIKACLKLD